MGLVVLCREGAQGAQNGLNKNDDLLDTINEYSVQFAKAGISAEEMFNMLQNGAEAGTWSVDKLGDAFKEFCEIWDIKRTHFLKNMSKSIYPRVTKIC